MRNQRKIIAGSMTVLIAEMFMRLLEPWPTSLVIDYVLEPDSDTLEIRHRMISGSVIPQQLRVMILALTGGDGGEAARLADLVLNVSSTTTTARIQETHITVAHILCELVEENLCGPQTSGEPAGGRG